MANKSSSKIDFERAKLLMDIVVSAGQHGPIYQHLSGMAGEELKKMIEDDKNETKVVTPADGPANGALQRPDGSVERLKTETPQPVRRAIPSTSDEGLVDKNWQAREDARRQSELKLDASGKPIDETNPTTVTRKV